MAPRHLKKRTYKIKKSALILVVSLCLMFTSVVGGTYAWLFYDGTGNPSSSFAGTTVTLSFSSASATQIMVPGEYVSMPDCTIASGSRSCWVFARLDKGNTTSFGNCLEYTLDSTWEQLSTSGTYVYFGRKTALGAGGNTNVFSGKKITVKVGATKETIAGTADFTVALKYCVVQSEHRTYTEAQSLRSW